MITTRPVAVKMDYGIYAELEKEAYASGVPKNRIINKAVEHYIEWMDDRRRATATGTRLDEYIPTEMEDLGTYYLDNRLVNRLNELSRITATSRDTLLAMAIDLLIDDYNKRPFTYL